MLYRGQVLAGPEILSPLAREQGLPASRALVDELLSAGLTRQELADFAARYHGGEVPSFSLPPGLSSNRPGAVGIPTTAIPGIAADAKYSGAGGTVYVILVPRAQALLANGWPVYRAEAEHIILNQVPAGSIVRAIPSGEIGPLWVDETGQLVAGRWGPGR